mmetsp:Transcript_63187/g.206213  ORF Transcript_63187/g.206213 Transcript_63187/m.206213 type:complete len:218 (+) Transcript_63187:518-1171(+)
MMISVLWRWWNRKCSSMSGLPERTDAVLWMTSSTWWRLRRTMPHIASMQPMMQAMKAGVHDDRGIITYQFIVAKNPNKNDDHEPSEQMNLDRVRHARSHAQSQVGAEREFFLEHCLELRRDIWRLVVHVEPLQQLLKDCGALRLPRHHLSDEVLAPTAVHSQVPPHWVRELTVRGVPLGALLPKLDALDAALDDARHEDEVEQHREEELEVHKLGQV